MEGDGGHMSWARRGRVLERLDGMVGSGRITAEEAEGLRIASGPSEFDDVVRAISRRHAEARLAAGVRDGSLSQDEAGRLLERLDAGEHPRSLRAHLGGLGRRRMGRGT